MNMTRRHKNLARWKEEVEAARKEGRVPPPKPQMLERDASGDYYFNPGGTDYDVAAAEVVGKAYKAFRAVNDYWSENEKPVKGKNERQRRSERVNRALQLFAKAREILRGDAADAAGEIAKAGGVDLDTARIVRDYLNAEREGAASSARVAEWREAAWGAELSEESIQSMLPGYVKGSWRKVEGTSFDTWTARVKMEDGREKTVLYRRGDISKMVADETKNFADKHSDFGASRDRRLESTGKPYVKWEDLPQSRREEIAAAAWDVNGHMSSGGKVAIEMKDGKTVYVDADAVVSLADGRTGALNLGRVASNLDARHETFHALWHFAKETMPLADREALADAFGIERERRKSEEWDRDLDERMAHEFERYASGHWTNKTPRRHHRQVAAEYGQETCKGLREPGACAGRRRPQDRQSLHLPRLLQRGVGGAAGEKT